MGETCARSVCRVGRQILSEADDAQGFCPGRPANPGDAAMAVISIRGTNGSGKSTVVRQVFAQCARRVPIYGLLGLRQPEAYQCVVPHVPDPVFVLGPYLTECGGCDAVQP